jgi:hypothetical protein
MFCFRPGLNRPEGPLPASVILLLCLAALLLSPNAPKAATFESLDAGCRNPSDNKKNPKTSRTDCEANRAEASSLQGVSVSGASAPKNDPKGSTAPEYSNNRPRQSLGAVESQRKDELSGKELWKHHESFTLHELLKLPHWVSLSVEERVRYEDYATPWRGGSPGKASLVGQYAFPIQSVVWAEARWTEHFRTGFEFWDARQYGGPDQAYLDKKGQWITRDYPDSLTNSMINAGQFAQVYAAWIARGLWGTQIDSETKAGQMTMSIGSQRLIGRAAFRNTQQQYVGIQQRFRSQDGVDEFLGFANVPEALMPGADPNGTLNTQKLLHNDVVWNRPLEDTYFTGGILTHKFQPAVTSEAYLYYLNEGPTTNLQRNLFSPGFRIVTPSRKGEINYEFETIGQTGSSIIKTPSANPNGKAGYLPEQPVGSLYQHIHIGTTLDTAFDPRLTAQWDYGTSHFDTLYGPTVFEFGPTGIGGFFSNRTNINSPGWKFEFLPHRDVTIYLNQRWWWTADATSTSGWAAAGIFNPRNHVNYQGSYIGETLELNARWDAHDHVAFQGGWQVLMKGNLAIYGTGAPGVTCNGLTASSCFGSHPNGSNVNYFFLQTEIRL